MKTSTMGIIVGSSALASAGAVKVSKGYQQKKMKMEKQNKRYNAMQEMKRGIKHGVKTGAEKTTEAVKSGIETEKTMVKSGLDKTIEGVKSGITTQQKMMEKEKEMLDKVNSSIQKKDMTMGVVVGSTALITTGIVLALNAFQKKQESIEIDQNNKSAAMQKIEGGIKTGTDKLVSSVKGVVASTQKKISKDHLEHVGETVSNDSSSELKFIPDSSVKQEQDVKESKDAERDPAYKGLTQLDTQYRDEWQANGIPQTHAEMKKLEREGETGQNDDSLAEKAETLKEKLEKNNAE